MKTFLIMFSVLLVSLFLSGCSSSNRLSQDQLFQKNQECNLLENKIIEQLGKKAPLRQELIVDNLSNTGGYHGAQTNLKQIFYNQQTDSCAYSRSLVEDKYLSYNITDFSTNKLIYQDICMDIFNVCKMKDENSFHVCANDIISKDNCDGNSEYKRLDKKIKELKG